MLTDPTARYRQETLEVDGEPFTVGTWQGTTAPILALHGVSSNHLIWSWVAAADPALTIIAPDLRGRAGSTGAGPFGLEQHRDDVVALLDELGLEQVVLAGMSLGAYIAVALAATAPERFAHVLLVDGGLPLQLPDQTRDAMVAEVERRATADTTFTDVASYTEAYLGETLGADLDRSDPLLHASMAWNLRGEPPHLEVRTVPDAVAQDARDVFVDAPIATWLEDVSVPMDLVTAGSSMLDEQALTLVGNSAVTSQVRVPDTDHASIIMGERGAMAVAGELHRLLEGS